MYSFIHLLMMLLIKIVRKAIVMNTVVCLTTVSILSISSYSHSVLALLVVVDRRSPLKLTFGDADSQHSSQTSKRLRLVTDSIDCLADLREQLIPSLDDKSPRKFKLLFGGSSEELSPQLSRGDEDHGDVVDDDVTPGTESASDLDSWQSEHERQDQDVMTQADEQAMKTYLPLNRGALSYISDDDADGNILDFFLNPPSSRLPMASHESAKNELDIVKEAKLYPSTFSDSGTGNHVSGEEVKSSSVSNKTSSLIIDQSIDVGIKSTDSKPVSTVISEFIDDDRQLMSAAVTRGPDNTGAGKEDAVRVMNEPSCSASTVAPSRVPATNRTTLAGTDHAAGSSSSVGRLMCSVQSYSQSSEDFQTPASQNSTRRSVVVLDGDVTSRSAGSQPLSSDSTIDVGCSPVKNRLHAAGTSLAYFASDATTTDGWCTPCQSSVPDVVGVQSPCPRLTNIASCTTQPDQTFDDRPVVSPGSPCSALAAVNSSTSHKSPASHSSPSLVRSIDRHTSTGLAQLSNAAVNFQLCQDATDNYDGDVDSDCGDVISLRVGVRRRRTARQRLRSRSTSADTVVISSDSDQSALLQASRDRSKDGVVGAVDVTVVSSGNESDESTCSQCNEADSQPAVAAAQYSPVLFSESSASGFI